MSQLLSTWKEVANYFGKGVRTVQRWERGARLPIHRPSPFSILADTTELEQWVHQNDGNAQSTKRSQPEEESTGNPAPREMD